MRHDFADPPALTHRRGIPLGVGGGREQAGQAGELGGHGRLQVGVVCGGWCGHREPPSFPRYAAKRSSDVANPARASGLRYPSGAFACRIWSSVRSPRRSRKVEVVVTPESGSVHTIRSGSTISTYTARVGYRPPSESLTMKVSNTPPGRASTLIVSSGVLTPAGPQKWVRCSGSSMQRKTSSRGASNTRVIRRSWVWVVLVMVASLRWWT